jgi:hypothetical protein
LLAEVRRDLAQADFDVDTVLDAINVIIGKADAKAAAKARRIKGVASVDEDTEVGINLPESDPTW